MEESKTQPAPEVEQAPSAPAAPAAPAKRAPAAERAPRPERNGQSAHQQRRAPGGRFGGPRPPRSCPFCAQKVKTIDYKTADQLRRYLTDHGKIKARRKVGTCAKHQRLLAIAIKRARHVALLPFSTESARGE